MGAESVAALVKGHALSFREAYADRQVNNVYLDDIELGDFMENLYGLSQRRKFRIRWYGEEMLAVRKPVLEVKVRSEGLGDKYFYPLGDFALGGPVELRQHVGEALGVIRAGILRGDYHLPLGVMPLGDLRPTLVNTYVRSYYVSLDGRFRLTIDRDLRFYDPNFRVMPGVNGQAFEGVIVEVKYDAVHDEAYGLVERGLPFQLSRNSKYVTGVGMLV